MTDHHHPAAAGAADWTDDGHGRPDWDARYRESSQIWSGEPNGALVAEIKDALPGRALDIGCGEGADAIWLARQGWRVTALDVSRVALERAMEAAQRAGVDVTWLHAGLVEAALPAASFDLVSAQYPALLKTADHQAERAMFDAVAPGGTLLVVHHAEFNAAHAPSPGLDPADYLSPEDVAAALDDGWVAQPIERRDRSISGGAGAHHSHDIVLRAQRAG